MNEYACTRTELAEERETEKTDSEIEREREMMDTRGCTSLVRENLTNI